MLDTNALAQVNDTALAAKAVAQQWWPSFCALAVLLGRELRNFNQWLFGVAEYVIGHGGLGMIFKKLVWNPKNTNENK